MNPPRQQQMRRLAPEEGDGFGGADRDAHDRAGGAVDAARQVDGENRRAIGVDRLDHLERFARHRPIETGAEQRIDDQRRLADRLRIERQHRIFPAPRRRGRVALQAVALAQQDDRNLAAARRQFSRRHETVAAIIAAARRPPGSAPPPPGPSRPRRRPGPRSASAQSRACPAAIVSRSARSISAVVRTSMPIPWYKRLFLRHFRMPRAVRLQLIAYGLIYLPISWASVCVHSINPPPANAC